jgi:hypothetical protein
VSGSSEVEERKKRCGVNEALYFFPATTSLLFLIDNNADN